MITRHLKNGKYVLRYAVQNILQLAYTKLVSKPFFHPRVHNMKLKFNYAPCKYLVV